MGGLVEYSVREGVALVTIDNPPVNALSQPVRARLSDCMDAAIADDEVGAIVIQAAGRTFPAGADLRDLCAHAEDPTLGEVCARIENSAKPVVAAIHGTALGGGLELALACHYRLAEAKAQLGLPDVALGLVPSAGASQRLPRLVGARVALDMLIAARPVNAAQAARLGLIDKAVDGNLARAAFGSARNLIGLKTGPRPTRDRHEGLQDARAYLDQVEDRRTALAGDRREAAHRAVDLVEAALVLPYAAGLELERVAFEDLVESDQARALRHIFLAERRTAQGHDLAGVAARRIARVGIVGAGAFGTGIARACLDAGLAVTLTDPDPEALGDGRQRLTDSLASRVEKNRLSAAERDARLAALTVTPGSAALADCDLVIDATEDDGPARAELFAQLAAITDPGTVLASAPLTADIDALALASGRPEDVLGLHFARPAHRQRLLEIVSPRDGAPDLVATGVALARALRKVPVLPARRGAGIAAPVVAALWRAAVFLIEEGATPSEIDAALQEYGFAQGLMRYLDMIGLDHLPAGAPEGGLVARMLARGWSGEKAGQGFYTYGEGEEATAPDVAALIAEHRHELGLTPRRVGADEIRARCVDAMTNAGARFVAAGIAARPSDIDVAMVTGFGFPRWRGGPMEAADLEGLLTVRNRLRGWAKVERDADLWVPEPLFDELIKNGRNFSSLNR